MKFKQSPKRCYICCKPFSETVKPIPVIAGKGTSGYICPACYVKMFRRYKKSV